MDRSGYPPLFSVFLPEDPCPPSLDNEFGPLVNSCRRSFDFTLFFEQSVLSITPAAICLLLTVLRTWQLWSAPPRVRGYVFATIKSVLWVGAGALQLLLVVLWSARPAQRSQAAIPAATLALVTTCVLVPLSLLEHYRSIRPSPLITSYLLFSTLLDLAQLRTLWLLQLDVLVPQVFSGLFGVKLVLLFAECMHKTRSFIKHEDAAKSPEDRAGIISRSFFFWINGLIYQGYMGVLTMKHIYPTPAEFHPEPLEEKLRRVLDKTSPKMKHRLLLVTGRVFISDLLTAALARLFLMGFTICQPFLLLRLISFLHDDTQPISIGYGLLGAYAIVYLGIAVSNAWYWSQNFRLMLALRAALTALIYDKTTQLSISAVDKSASVTIMSADIERILHGLITLQEIWAIVVQVAVVSALLAKQIGNAIFVPFAVGAVCLWGTFATGTYAGRQQAKWMKKIESRIGVTSNTISSMRGVKLSGLTEQLADVIQGLRVNELKIAAKFRWGVIGAFMTGYFPILVTPSLTLAVFAIIAHANGYVLDTAKMFTSISLLILINQPLAILFPSAPYITSMITCFDRINKFIETDQRSDPRHKLQQLPEGLTGNENGDSHSANNQTNSQGTVDRVMAPANVAITVSNGEFGWVKGSKPVLKDVNLSFAKGKFTMIIGPVGCGKTTLLKALLGELPSSRGLVSISSDVLAYCDQTPWIVNATLKENITSLTAPDDTFYKSVLYACALEEDLDHFPDGDNSQLGSKGITLSGGQKQRVALARAVFARHHLNVYDDVLSGLDANTEARVFNRVFGPQGILRTQKATVVLATHAVHLLPYADHIISIGTNGQIVQQGTFQELSKSDGYVKSLNISKISKSDDSENTTSAEDTMADAQLKANAVPEEEENLGVHQTPFSAYAFYFKAIGIISCVIYLFIALGYAFFYSFPNIWAKWWSDANERNPGQQDWFYVSIYTVLQLLSALFLLLLSWHGLITIVNSSGAALHWKVLTTTLWAPLSFFEKTDTGKTLNRFGYDMQLIDGELPNAIYVIFWSGLVGLAQLTVVMTTSFYLAVSFPFILIMLAFLIRIHVRTSRQLRLLELETKTPLYTQFLESLDGLATIRAFCWESQFKALNYERLDKSQRPLYLRIVMQRWLGTVLEMLTLGVVLLVVALIVVLRGQISAGYAGVALSNMIIFSFLVGNMVIVWTQMENAMVSVERIKEFSEDTPNEKTEAENVEPPENWPSQGRVQIQHLNATYRSGATKALQDVVMEIKPGEKIGVCGRTGSGKTSMMLALFKMIEISGGNILVDGIDIGLVPPNRVRGALNAIPQEPFFLTGSIRLNLDPYGTAKDEDIEKAISKVRLAHVVEEKGGLDAEIDKETLSQGERQLFCLARAMLKKSKVVVLDEATSNIDVETDRLIQKTIREEFNDSTVITIAHRLETILSSDRIAVLDFGKLIEFDAPQALLAKNSRFKSLYETWQKE